jgi:hypothetical protein
MGKFAFLAQKLEKCVDGKAEADQRGSRPDLRHGCPLVRKTRTFCCKLCCINEEQLHSLHLASPLVYPFPFCGRTRLMSFRLPLLSACSLARYFCHFMCGLFLWIMMVRAHQEGTAGDPRRTREGRFPSVFDPPGFLHSGSTAVRLAWLLITTSFLCAVFLCHAGSPLILAFAQPDLSAVPALAGLALTSVSRNVRPVIRANTIFIGMEIPLNAKIGTTTSVPGK